MKETSRALTADDEAPVRSSPRVLLGRHAHINLES